MTRLFSSLLLTLVTSTLTLTSWAATLTASDTLIIKEIDNKVIDHGYITNKSTFSIEQGKHAVIVQYKDVYEDPDLGDEVVIKSNNFVILFNVTDEKKLRLKTPTLNTMAQANAFSSSPKLLLLDEKNNKLKLEIVGVSDYKLTQEVNKAVNTYSAKQNNTKKITPTIKEPSILNKSTVTPTQHSLNSTTTSNTLLQVNALTMLKYWWENASIEEKKNFKQHVNSKN